MAVTAHSGCLDAREIDSLTRVAGANEDHKLAFFFEIFSAGHYEPRCSSSAAARASTTCSISARPRISEADAEGPKMAEAAGNGSAAMGKGREKRDGCL
jgi:hypothetical protein